MAISRGRVYTFTEAGDGEPINVTHRPAKDFAIQVKGTGNSATLWDVVIEGSLNGTQYQNIVSHTTSDGDGVVKWQTSRPVIFFRGRVIALTLGLATNIKVNILGVG